MSKSISVHLGDLVWNLMISLSLAIVEKEGTFSKGVLGGINRMNFKERKRWKGNLLADTVTN